MKRCTLLIFTISIFFVSCTNIDKEPKPRNIALQKAYKMMNNETRKERETCNNKGLGYKISDNGNILCADKLSLNTKEPKEIIPNKQPIKIKKEKKVNSNKRYTNSSFIKTFFSTSAKIIRTLMDVNNISK